MKYRLIRFPEGRAKAVTFSYDDGVRQDLRTAKIFDEYGLKGTFNINSARLMGGKALTADEIQESILDKGHEVAVHGELHKAPGLVRPIEGIRDVLNCRMDLERIFGRIIRGMAYPDSGIRQFVNQASYQDIRSYLLDLDIAYSRTLGGDNKNFGLPTDWYQWMPTAHHDNPNILDWAREFVELDLSNIYGSQRWAKLFYVWGHSYEFDQKDNWQHLIDLCEILAGKEDIWYATNMEIYEYVKAYDSLVFSADGSRIYNPSLQTVWFDQDGTLYQVGSGQTLTVG